MAPPLSRTWYDTLIDDTGDGLSGTIWNKGQVDGLLDTVDASLSGVVDKTGVPAVNQVAIFNDADTLRASSALSHDGNTLLATCTVPTVAGLKVVKPNAVAGTNEGTVQAYAAGPSYELRNKTNNHNWYFGLREEDSDALYIGVGASPASGFTPAIKVEKLNSVVALPLGQLRFPTAMTPHTDPYVLDNFRELPWTPTLSATGGASGQTYAMQWGQYQRIGKWCRLAFHVGLSVKGTMSGNVLIGGIPFFHDDNVPFSHGAMGWLDLNSTLASLAGHINTGGAQIELNGVAGGGATSSVVALPVSAVKDGSAFFGVLQYRVRE